MTNRSDIEAIIPNAAEAVYKATGIYPHGLGITGKDGKLALAVTLHTDPPYGVPGSILGVPTVFRIVSAPMFLNRRRPRR